MSHLKNDFDGVLRDVMEHYELPYEPSSWNFVEKKLRRSGMADASWIVAASATLLIVVAGSYAVYNSFLKDTHAIQGYSTPRHENFTPQNHVISLVPASDSQSTRYTDADLLLFSGVDFDNSVNSPSSPAASQPVSTSNSELFGPLNSAASGADSSTSVSGEGMKGGKNNENVSLGIDASIRTACAGNEIDFAVKNGPSGGSYLWNFGDGNFSNKPEPKHRYDKAGTFDVSLSVTDRNGRITTNVVSGLVTISPAPQADFEWDFVEEGADPMVKIINTSEHSSHFEWKFGDGSSSNSINPIKVYPNNGKHMVVLEVSNEAGCKDSKVKYIHINNDYSLEAPEKLNPSKEVFMPKALRNGRMNFKLKVYSGSQAIYETSNRSKGWDGRLPDGTLAESGEQFPWTVIIINETTKEEKYFSGTLTVIP